MDFDLIASRRAEFPAVRWFLSHADVLPFRDASFDALFAGELIEHLDDPTRGLREFRRVLKPGGALVLTTPNRLRLANLADGSERPYGPDHLSELSYDELLGLFPAEGFTIVGKTGVHLELFLNWLSPLPKLDRLQRAWNRRWAIPLMLDARGRRPRPALGARPGVRRQTELNPDPKRHGLQPRIRPPASARRPFMAAMGGAREARGRDRSERLHGLLAPLGRQAPSSVRGFTGPSASGGRARDPSARTTPEPARGNGDWLRSGRRRTASPGSGR